MEPRDREALRDTLTAIRRVQGFPIADHEAFLASGIRRSHSYDRVDIKDVLIILSGQLLALQACRKPSERFLHGPLDG